MASHPCAVRLLMAAARARAYLGLASAEPLVKDADTQTLCEEVWIHTGSSIEADQLCSELLKENELLEGALAKAQMEIVSLRERLAARTTAASSSAAEVPRQLELGYLVLRAPTDRSHLRGHHQVDWAELLVRLSLSPNESRPGFHIRCYTTASEAETLWRHQRLKMPIPLDPR